MTFDALPPTFDALRRRSTAGDAASFRRLEAAIENLANHVANADPSRLASATERLRRRLGAISSDLASIEHSEERWAAPYFPAAQEDARCLPQIEIVLRSNS